MTAKTKSRGGRVLPEWKLSGNWQRGRATGLDARGAICGQAAEKAGKADLPASTGSRKARKTARAPLFAGINIFAKKCGSEVGKVNTGRGISVIYPSN